MSDEEKDRMFARWGSLLSERYSDVRVNSVKHLVVPIAAQPPLMLGLESTEFGLIADFHCPLLTQVPRCEGLLEVIAMNSSLTELGTCRVGPDGDNDDRFVIELRHQVHAQLLNDDWVLHYAELIPRIGERLVELLQPAFGGAVVRSPAS